MLTARSRTRSEHVVSRAASALIAGLCMGVLAASPASADPASAVQQAVVSARSGSSCPALQYNPAIEKAAQVINQSTLDYVKHTAENVPADDPSPTALLKDFGIDTPKAKSLQGAAKEGSGAIKGALLQGYAAIPDCSYTQFGASQLYEPGSGYNLVVVVLVGQ